VEHHQCRALPGTILAGLELQPVGRLPVAAAVYRDFRQLNINVYCEWLAAKRSINRPGSSTLHQPYNLFLTAFPGWISVTAHNLEAICNVYQKTGSCCGSSTISWEFLTTENERFFGNHKVYFEIYSVTLHQKGLL